MKNFRTLLQSLYNTPPKQVVKKVKRRLAGHQANSVDFDSLFESSKVRPQRSFDFLTRYQAILRRTVGWQDLDFAGKDVFELGCGPLLGWGPMAVFLGCRSYVSCEPYYSAEVLDHPQFLKSYLLPLHKDLSGIYGEKYSLEKFREIIREKIKIYDQEFLHANVSGTFDVILSNSVLEHVFPLDTTVAALHKISAPGCKFLHLVDFGNHRRTANPFDGIYQSTPDKYFKMHGNGLNLLRIDDIKKVFANAGYQAAVVPYYSYSEDFQGPIEDYWLKRYSKESLFTKTAIVANSPVTSA